MKRLLKALLIILAFQVCMSACTSKIYPSTGISYISDDNGVFKIRTFGEGRNINDAIKDAEIKAIDVLLFRGLPASSQKTALISTDETSEKIKHADYFNMFYKKDRYKTFIISSIPTTKLNRIKGKSHGIVVTVEINLQSLITDMEANQIIRKFGY